MSFCRNCGAQIHEGHNFCAGCGASAGGENLVAQASADTAPSHEISAQQTRDDTLREPADLKAQAPPPSKGSGKKILIAALAVFLVGAIAAAAGVIYVGYRVKQKASSALDNFEGESGAHKATGQADSTNSKKSNFDKSKDGSSGSDSDNPLAGVLGKLKGSDDNGESTPMGNMFKDVIEDLGVKNPEIPPDLVRNIPYSALTNPLPCPAPPIRLIRQNWPTEESCSSPEPSSLTHGHCHWPTRRAITSSGRCLPHPLFLNGRASQAVTSL